MAVSSSQFANRVAFIVLACVALAHAIPSSDTKKVETTSAYPDLNPSFYVKENRGYYTGERAPNTVTEFARSFAVLRKCPHADPVFVEFLEKFTFEPETEGCIRHYGYVRDFRENKHQLQTQLSVAERLNFEIYSDESFPETSTYGMNIDKIWQVTVPRDYTVHINLSFWFDDLADGACGDYVALYADEDPPEVMCSKGLTTTTIVKTGIEELTIRFHSNERTTKGGFTGNVFMDSPPIRSN